MSWHNELDDLLEDLKEERDDLRVRAHLLKAEARDEWHDMEEKWGRFRSRSKRALDQTGEAGEDIGAAIRLLGQEIKHGYDRIRQSLR